MNLIEINDEFFNSVTEGIADLYWEKVLFCYWNDEEKLFHVKKVPDLENDNLMSIEISTKSPLDKNAIYLFNKSNFFVKGIQERKVGDSIIYVNTLERDSIYSEKDFEGKPYSEKELRVMEIALKLSTFSENQKKIGGLPYGGPFGALVIKGDKIIGLSCNQVLRLNDPSAHAEIMAIRDACSKLKTWNLEGCELYTSCEPCPMCLMAIKWANIKTVYYAADRKDAESVGFKDNDLYCLLKDNVSTGICIDMAKDKAVSIMKSWQETFGKENLY